MSGLTQHRTGAVGFSGPSRRLPTKCESGRGMKNQIPISMSVPSGNGLLGRRGSIATITQRFHASAVVGFTTPYLPRRGRGWGAGVPRT